MSLPCTWNYALLSGLFECEESVKMKTTNLARKNCGALRSVVLFLLVYLLAGCELPVSAPPKTVAQPPEPITPIQEPVVPKPKPIAPIPKPAAPTPKPTSLMPVIKSVAPFEIQRPLAQNTRIVIYFQQPTTDSSQLAAAVAEACRCKPVFFRQYRDNALIYIIGLPQDISYTVFENALLQNAAKLGIKSVEQEVVEHF